MPFKTTFNFVLAFLYLFQVNAFGESSERYSMKSSAGGYTPVEAVGRPIGDFTCDSDNNHPTCSTSMGGLIMKDTPANQAIGMQLTGPFAPRKDSRPDAPAEGRYTITNKDDGGKYIVVEYMKGSRTAFTGKTYYEYNNPGVVKGDDKDGDSGDSEAIEEAIVVQPSVSILSPDAESESSFENNIDLACVTPDDPRCQ